MDPDTFELWDRARHRLIARTAANTPRLTAFLLVVRVNVDWRGLRSVARLPEPLMFSDREHHAIIDAIQAGDPAAAQTRMHAHPATLARNLKRIPDPDAGLPDTASLSNGD